MHWLDRINPLLKLSIAGLLSAGGWAANDARSAAGLAAVVIAILLGCRLKQAGAYFKVAGTVGVLISVTWALEFMFQGMPLALAVDNALRLTFRLIATTGSFFVAVETTSAGSLLAACSRLRLPGTLTLVLVLVVGLIPLLREELQSIGETQRARGLELDRGPILQRALYALARGVPLMVQTYRMAEAIALSLSIYGFDPRLRRSTWRRVGPITIESSLSHPISKRP